MEIIQVALSLLGVLGLIFVLLYAMKRLTKRVSVSGGNKMRVLDRVGLGTNGMLLVVAVCGRLMVVGCTATKIEKICDLDMTEEEYLATPEGEKATMSFGQAFSTVLKNKYGKPGGGNGGTSDDKKSNQDK